METKISQILFPYFCRFQLFLYYLFIIPSINIIVNLGYNVSNKEKLMKTSSYWKWYLIRPTSRLVIAFSIPSKNPTWFTTGAFSNCGRRNLVPAHTMNKLETLALNGKTNRFNAFLSEEKSHRKLGRYAKMATWQSHASSSGINTRAMLFCARRFGYCTQLL